MSHIHFEQAGSGIKRGVLKWRPELTWQDVHNEAARRAHSDFLYDVRLFVGHGGPEVKASGELVGECPEAPITILPLTDPTMPELRVQVQDNSKCLLEAIDANCSAHRLRLLLAAKADVTYTNHHGATALHWCALKGRVHLAKVLLDHKACVDSTNENSCTPLVFCAVAGESGTLPQLLLDYGANPKFVMRNGRSVLQLCQNLGRFHLAALLRAHGAVN